MKTQKVGVIEELERLDRFLEGEEAGEVPVELLRARGIDIPEDDTVLDDDELHAKLWQIIEGMAEIGVFMDSTDHLSDRELYRWLVTDGLRQETFLAGEGGWTQTSPVGDDDSKTWLRHYADDEDREMWARDFGETLPPKEKPPYDRDRLLPDGETRALGPAQ